MAAAKMYVIPGGAGAKNGAAWSTAFSEVEFQADLEGAAEAGDIYYIMEGTYNASAAYDSSARDGSTTSPITFVGVKDGTNHDDSEPVIADYSDANLSGGADDRPVFVFGANACTFGDAYKLLNIKFTCTSATGIVFGINAVLYNCKFTGQSDTNDRYAVNAGTDTNYISCEACGLVGTGVVCRGFGLTSRSRAIFCYAHDCRSGVYIVSDSYYSILFNVFEDCSVAAISATAGFTGLVMNNTINDCAIGFTEAGGRLIAINNLLEGCTGDGFKKTTQRNISFLLNNHGDDVRNNDMWDLVATAIPHGDLNNTTGDPLFDGDGNLSLQSTSPCINAGASAVLGT